MFVVGLTGGIGSGKSAAAERFRQHGVTVVNVDDISREVVMPGNEALDQITQRFGIGVLNSNGSLDRGALRAHIFENIEARQWLENLLHPLIRQTSEQRLQQKRLPSEPAYRVLEVPLLFETNGQDRVDRVLLITADSECRIRRVIERDNSERQQVQAILDAQMPDAQKKALADDCIDNSTALETLHQEIDALHQLYCHLGNR